MKYFCKKLNFFNFFINFENFSAIAMAVEKSQLHATMGDKHIKGLDPPNSSGRKTFVSIACEFSGNFCQNLGLMLSPD